MSLAQEQPAAGPEELADHLGPAVDVGQPAQGPDAGEDQVVAAGAQDVDGVRWIVYEGGEDSRPVWTTRLKGPTGPAQIAVTGPAGTDEYRTLAKATQTQPPLPVV